MQEQVHDVIIIGSGASWRQRQSEPHPPRRERAPSRRRHALPPRQILDAREALGMECQASIKGAHAPSVLRRPKDAPFDTPKDQPFDLVRVWGRGGKTNVWGRVSLRYSDVDFAGPERDGWEIPWPIRYKDIKSYYDRVDQLIGVCGGIIDDQDSLAPAAPTCWPPPHRPDAANVSCRKPANPSASRSSPAAEPSSPSP